MHLSFKNIGRASINKKAMTLFNEFSLAINTRHPGTRASAAPVIFIIALLMLAGIIHPTLAASSPQSGRIRGKIVAVTADKREPLSGVLVSLSSDVLQDKTLEIVSDEEGGYVFSGLVAGDYVVSVTLQGFEKYERKVIVPIEAVVDLNVLLTPLALSESVTVTEAEGGLAKTESSLPSQVTTQNLRNAPLVNERFQDALPLLPGVVRGPDGALNIKGGRASQSGILVSSLNVTDPVTGNPGINLPLEAVELIQVYSNPYSAEYGKFTGAVTTIETRSGSNQWRYLITNVLVRPRLQNGKIVGVQSATPRIAVGGPLV